MSTKQTMILLFKELKKYRFLVILSILLALINVALTLINPILVGNAIDLIVGQNNVDFNGIYKIFILLSIVIAGICVSQFVMTIVNNNITYSLIKDVRNKAIVKIEHLPLSYIDSHSYGQILSNIISDVDQLCDGLLMGFSQLFTGVLTIVGTIVLMFIYRWQIALVVVFVTPLSLFVAKFIASRTHSMFIKQSMTRGEQTAFIEEMINNQKVIQAFNKQDDNQESFDEINSRLYTCSLRANFFSALTNPSTRFVNSIVYAVVTLVGAYQVISIADATIFGVGRLSSFLSFANQYTKPFNDISSVITELQNSFACASRVFELLAQEEEVDDSNNKELIAPEGNIEIEHVYFSYVADKPLIKDFNLSVKKGKRIAIVGPTGCGKTTLINLLMRFYDTNEGTITYDGNKITEITRKSLRDNIGMVLQETWLKSGTIKENIIMGKEDATEEEIINACKEANSYNFIMQLENGFDTHINEDGGSLSQGQKQLLCITRIMLACPNILILDEATSSIDTRTELKIQEAFEKLMKGRTSFIVAHRLSTIQSADIILVMKDGNIIEMGNHEELIKKQGFYYNLYNSQFARD
jgi:ATP-binding cassette, subfamily B, multidrug efflux pump